MNGKRYSSPNMAKEKKKRLHQLKSKLLLVAIMLMVCGNVRGYDFVVDGIYYRIKSSINNTVEVTYNGSLSTNNYSGNINIPNTVTYNNKEYTVTAIGWSAFYNCDSLISVSIPKSVNSIYTGAFITHWRN